MQCPVSLHCNLEQAGLLWTEYRHKDREFVFVVDLVMCGVGYHHAGLDVDDRKLVERMFSQGLLAVLSQFSRPAVY